MAEDPLELVGVTLDARFRVDVLVDDGDLSLTYRGRDLTSDKPVAVRCLNLPMTMDPALAGPFVESFRERTQRHSRLAPGSASFVAILASGETKAPVTGFTVPYEVREWLDAMTLGAFIARRRAEGSEGWPLDEVLALLGPVADGLAYAHDMGVTHGAVNPNNLLVIEGKGRPQVRIVDFGEARSDDKGNFRPVLRVLVPEYTAPEQIDKQLGAMGPWSDVFSLAVIVLECLAGSLPTRGLAASAIVDPKNRPSPKKLGLTLPGRVEDVLDRGLSFERRLRPQRVATFWRELKAAAGTLSKAPPAIVSPLPRSVSNAPLPPPPPRTSVKPPLPARSARPNPLVKATLVGIAPQSLFSNPPPAITISNPPPADKAFPADEAPTWPLESSSQTRVPAGPPASIAPPGPPTDEPFPESMGTASFDEPDIFMPALGRPSLGLRLKLFGRWLKERLWPWLVARAKDDAPRARALFGASVFGALLFFALCLSLCIGRGAPKPASVAAAPSTVAQPPASATAAADPVATVASVPPVAQVPPPDIPDTPPVATPSAAPSPVPFTKALAGAALDAAAGDMTECRQLGTIRGPGSIRVTFNKSGAVARISIGPPYADTPEGACILDRFGRAQLPPIRGAGGAVNYSFNLPK